MHPVVVSAAVQAGRPLLKVTAAVTVLGLVTAGMMTMGLAGGQALSSIAEQVAAPGQTCTGGIGPASVQVTNMGAVAAQGRSMGFPDPALVIAGATILVESGARNLASLAVPESARYPNDGTAPGDHDSVGLFQQRAGWGTVQERMTPSISARLFFERLGGIPWQSMAPGAAAQKVQVSAFPDRYATRMAEATTLLAQAVGSIVCTQQPPPAGGSGFTNGPGGGAGNSPRTAEQAIAWARAESASHGGGWYRRCLSFVAQAYGNQYSGVPYAIDHFTVVPANQRHAADSPEGRTPPPGAALYWSTGSRSGHIALYLGNGELATNDMPVSGQIGIVPASDIETKWGATYVGWTDPGAFPRGG